MSFNSNDSKKITFLMGSLRAGGGERVMIMLANDLAKRGYAIDMLVLKNVGEYQSHLDPRVHVVVFDAWRMLAALPKLVRYFKQVRPSIAVGTDENTHLLLLAANYISGGRTKIVLRIGNVFSELYSRYSDIKHTITFKLIKMFYRYADVLIANSQGVADDIIELAHMDPHTVHVIFNPKPLDEIREKGAEQTGNPWFDEKTFPVVLGVGRLREQKNFPLLLKAFARIQKKVPSRLAIIGGGRDEEALRSLARELGIENSVFFSGYADNPFAYMSRADVYVLASLWEGMPNSLMEAMVCGVSVVAADCKSGPRELLAPDSNHTARLDEGVEYGPYGILAAVGDEDAFAKAIEELLTNAQLRETYVQASKKRAEDFDSARIMAAYAQAIGLADTHS